MKHKPLMTYKLTAHEMAVALIGLIAIKNPDLYAQWKAKNIDIAVSFQYKEGSFSAELEILEMKGETEKEKD